MTGMSCGTGRNRYRCARYTGSRPITAVRSTILALLALCLLPTAAAAEGLAGVREIASSNAGPVAGPRAAMNRAFAEVRDAPSACAEGDDRKACAVIDFRAFVDGLAEREVTDQLAAVNRHVNRATYVSDTENYGRRDYWAAPSGLFVRGGDCEDYVLAKYAALRQLGVPDSAMRIYVARHTRARIAHAVLVVSTRGGSYVLDNESDMLRPMNGIGHLQPLYSFNQVGYWLYLAS